jgi:uncharacterized lipoprotein YajG
MTQRKLFQIVAIICSCLLFSACSQIPTDKQSAVDMRPQISFKPTSESTLNARVYLDGRDVGSVSEYLEGQSALKVLPGKHIVTVVLQNQNVLQETIYVGHGISRTIIVQ